MKSLIYPVPIAPLSGNRGSLVSKISEAAEDHHQFWNFFRPLSDTMATPAATPPSVSKQDQNWADVTDDEEEDSAPTIKVDTLDLTSLSLNEKNKDKPTPTGTSPIK